MRAVKASSPAAGRSLLRLVRDEDEGRVLAGQAHLDVAGRKLLVQLEHGFRERVEQAQADRGLERQREATGCFCRRVVAEFRHRVEIGPERIDESL